MSAQMLPISSDNLGFKLDDSPPTPQTAPGAHVLFDHTIQSGPMLFGRLNISRQIGISTAGKALMCESASWYVDNVTLDGSSIDLTGGYVVPMRAARHVTMRATNIGKDPAYFYGAWELYEIDPLSAEQKNPVLASKDIHKSLKPSENSALDHEVRRIMQLDDARALSEVTRMASNWRVEHGADLEGDDGISGSRTIALAYQARLAAITDDKRWIGEVGYLTLLRRILDHGQHRTDRTGTGTISVFGAQLRFDLREGFPLLTTKKVPFTSIVCELLWFLRGSTNIHDLGAPIWNEWAAPDGDLGPIYGHQWRRWGADHEVWKEFLETESRRTARDQDISQMDRFAYFQDGPSGIDQISEAIETIKKSPDSRRIIVSAWNVSDVPKMRLPPCHLLFQFYVQDGCLDCQLYQRSADMALGVPFNIASYALLTEMVAKECGLTARYFVHTFGDAHIYLNHVDGVRKQLARTPLELPRLVLADKPVLKQTLEDVVLEGYQHHPPIKFKVSV